ncbi:hypothetical protein ACSSVY_001016 [Roseovarius sp. MBR-51]
MRRSEICAIAQMSAQTFMTHRANGNLPFEVAVAEVDGGGRTWVRYDIHDAAFLIAARSFTDQGILWSSATEILRAKALHLGRDPHPWTVDYIHVAKASFRNSDGNSPLIHKSEVVFRGRIEEIAAAAFGRQQRENDRNSTPHIFCTGLISVSLSQAYHEAYARARALGVDLSDDDVWEIGL